jgi:hypothetical protein
MSEAAVALTVEHRGGREAWARLWARLFDVSVLMTPAYFGLMWWLGAQTAPNGLPWMALYLQIDPARRAVLDAAAVGLISMAIEAILLSTWGTTPGKALMGVTVREADGRRLGPLRAARRWFLVYLYGTGLPFFPAIYFGPIRAYERLRTQGRTGWDAELGLSVVRRPVGAGRWIALFVILTLAVLVLAAVEANLGYDISA